MGLIVDASVALKLALPELGVAEAKRLFASEAAHAPDILAFEVANGLIKDLRLHPRPRSNVTIEHGLILDSYTRMHETTPLLARGLEIGLMLDHQVYDCLYLALAERLDFPLVTADGKFLKKVAAQGWTNIRPLVP